MAIPKWGEDERILKINQRYYKTLMERSSLNIILRYPNGNSSFDDKWSLKITDSWLVSEDSVGIKGWDREDSDEFD
jgi:hypothetical protein